MINILQNLFNEYFPTIVRNECSVVSSAERVVPFQTEPSQFAEDIKALQGVYGELKSGMKINLSLRQALELIPRSRKRSDAYKGLKSELMKHYGVALNVGKQHTDDTKNE